MSPFHAGTENQSILLRGARQHRKLYHVEIPSSAARVVPYYTLYTLKLCRLRPRLLLLLLLLAHLQMIPERRRRHQRQTTGRGNEKAGEGEQDSPLVSDAPLTLNPHRAPTRRQDCKAQREING